MLRYLAGANQQTSAGECVIRVLIAVGQEAHRSESTGSVGGYRVNLNFDVAAGVYLLEVSMPGERETHSVVVE